jgi:catechol 2,3-dioxygenase-like lactoylglutathione lyase family enzyme
LAIESGDDLVWFWVGTHTEYERLIRKGYDIAIPTLPSRSVRDTLVFYRRLGFDGRLAGAGDSYAILTRGAIEIHFFTHRELRPAESSAGCYVRVLDVRAIYEAFALAKLAPKGIPRMDALEDKPWGMREFAIVDPDGNLLRIGQAL